MARLVSSFATQAIGSEYHAATDSGQHYVLHFA